VEVADAGGQMLGIDGLVAMLRGRGYPDSDIQMDMLEEELLRYSNAIRLEDDLTLIEIRFTGA
jgi:serine phosphatase RsbU (regulator of sigma subunit)